MNKEEIKTVLLGAGSGLILIPIVVFIFLAFS
jgi:hypothetical protein